VIQLLPSAAAFSCQCTVFDWNAVDTTSRSLSPSTSADTTARAPATAVETVLGTKHAWEWIVSLRYQARPAVAFVARRSWSPSPSRSAMVTERGSANVATSCGRPGEQLAAVVLGPAELDVGQRVLAEGEIDVAVGVDVARDHGPGGAVAGRPRCMSQSEPWFRFSR
jgi:hypothetical protein